MGKRDTYRAGETWIHIRFYPEDFHNNFLPLVSRFVDIRVTPSVEWFPFNLLQFSGNDE